MSSSWDTSGEWYDKIVGESGHYYHETIIFPKAIPLLELPIYEHPKILDLACGQGVLARRLPKGTEYVGVDLAPSLIKAAKKQTLSSKALFLCGDVSKALPLAPEQFTHATLILSLQNISEGLSALKNAHLHLKARGKLLIVLNHPCFRIPRQSSWGVDTAKKLQYRRIDRYLSPLRIPLQTHPGKQDATTTLSFHEPLSTYFAWLKEAGFVTILFEEWCSDKKSSGEKAKMENRCREEFPLFLALLAEKK